jgi:hypothetical protein
VSERVGGEASRTVADSVCRHRRAALNVNDDDLAVGGDQYWHDYDPMKIVALFGSDAMIWPETIDVAIQSIETATFLTEEQKRDIFYRNAARFLRLSEQEIASHHRR